MGGYLITYIVLHMNGGAVGATKAPLALQMIKRKTTLFGHQTGGPPMANASGPLHLFDEDERLMKKGSFSFRFG